MWKNCFASFDNMINLPITFGIAKPFIGMVRGAKKYFGWRLFGSENKSRIYISGRGISDVKAAKSVF